MEIVVPVSSLTAISNSKWYYRALFFHIIFTMIAAQLNVEPKPWLQFSLMLVASAGVVFFLVIELTRIDRFVLGQLVQYFEYWLLLTNLIAMLACIPYARMASDRSQLTDAEWARVSQAPSLMVFNFFVFFISTWFSFSLDASVRTTPRVKTFILSLLLLNILYNYARDFWQPVPARPFCLIICTNSRSLYVSSLLTILCFTCKYLLRSIRNPNALIIITPMSFIQSQKHCEPPATTDTTQLQEENIPSDSMEMVQV